MLAKVYSAAVYGVDAFEVEIEVNGGKGDVARQTHSQETCASGMTARLSSGQVEGVRQRCNDLRERDVTRSVL